MAGVVGPVLEAKGVLGDEIVIVQIVADDDVGYPQSQSALCAGPDADPFVGLGGRHRSPALQLHNLGPHVGPSPAHAAVGSQLAHQRLPGLQKSAAEAQQIVGILPVVGGMLVPALAQQVGQGRAICAVMGVAHLVRCAEGPAEAGNKVTGGAALAVVEKDQPLRTASISKLAELVCNFPQGVIPGNGLPLSATPFTHTLQGILDPIGVIQYL